MKEPVGAAVLGPPERQAPSIFCERRPHQHLWSRPTAILL